MRFKDIPQLPKAHYNVHISWEYLEENLERYASTWTDERGKICGGLNLNPPYQRAHVWTEQQQIAYVEYMLMGGEVGRNIIWNCPTWMKSYKHPLELVDGKQRLEAVRKFLRNDLPVFGKTISEFEDKLKFIEHHFIFSICCLESEKEILQLYLNINAGGTPHTEGELDMVRKMLKALDK